MISAVFTLIGNVIGRPIFSFIQFGSFTSAENWVSLLNADSPLRTERNDFHPLQYFGRSLLFLSVHLSMYTYSYTPTATRTTKSEHDLNGDGHCLTISIFICICLRFDLISHFVSGSVRFIVFGAKNTIEVISLTEQCFACTHQRYLKAFLNFVTPSTTNRSCQTKSKVIDFISCARKSRTHKQTTTTERSFFMVNLVSRLSLKMLRHRRTN